jgi:DNA mismatch repair protein MutH
MTDWHDRARALVESISRVRGQPFGSLYANIEEDHGAPDKALGARVLAHYIGDAGDGSDAGPTVRTLPIGGNQRVLWPTKVCALKYQAVCETPFAESRVSTVLAAVLFVPILKPDRLAPSGWSFGTPFVWAPTPRERAQLERDYEDIRALIRRGHGDRLSSFAAAGYGDVLMPKTSGRNRLDLETYMVGSSQVSARKRAFFLRETRTTSLFQASYPTATDPEPSVHETTTGRDLDLALRQLAQEPSDGRGDA